MAARKGSVVFGMRPVAELLARRPRAVRVLWVAEGRRGNNTVSQIFDAAKAAGVRVESSTVEQLDALCEAPSQGVVAAVGDYQYVGVDALFAQRGALLVAADCVTDPQNLGAMVRSAVVFGASGLILPKDRSASINDVVVRVSSGASEHLPCARVTNLSRTLRDAKGQDFWTVGAVERGGLPPERVDFTVPTILIVGNEQKGIRPNVLKACDVLTTIPAVGSFSALNVASATAALLSEAARQRRQS